MSRLQQHSGITTDEILWHYTNGKACQSILESNKLRLTNIWTYRCRPDTEADWQEFIHGLDIFSQSRHGRPANGVWSNLNEIVKLYSPFVMCFSKSDANDTLWNGRAGQDGACLGFSRKSFFDVFPKSVTFPIDRGAVTYDLQFCDCIYDREDKTCQMTDYFTSLDVQFAEGEPSFPLDVLFKAVFLKRKRFSPEQEVRFALAPSQLPAGEIPGLSCCEYYSLSPDRGQLPVLAVTATSEKARGKIATVLKKMRYSNVDIRLRSVT